jgi:hypothetical protein
MERLLRELLREIIEDETRELEEFSGVAALGGGPMMPLGVDATYPAQRKKSRRKGKRVNEVNTVAIALGPFTDVNDNGVPDNLETNMFRDRSEMYEDSVECLARSFGGAESPFKNQRAVEKFLRYDP